MIGLVLEMIEERRDERTVLQSINIFVLGAADAIEINNLISKPFSTKNPAYYLQRQIIWFEKVA